MRFLFFIFGCVSFLLGSIGIVLPLIPTVPFYLLASICFARSSQKLEELFLASELYQNHVVRLRKNKEMTLQDKIIFLSSITLVFGFGFATTSKFPVVRTILLTVWVMHIVYFGIRVKTIPLSTKSNK